MADKLTFQCQDSVATNVDDIANRTGLSESEVLNRLIKLGLQDIDEIDDEVLFGTVSGSTDGDPAD